MTDKGKAASTQPDKANNPTDPEAGATRKELKGDTDVPKGAIEPAYDASSHGGGWFGKAPEQAPHEATTPLHKDQNPE